MSTHTRTIEAMVLGPDTGPAVRLDRDGRLIRLYVQTAREAWKEVASLHINDLNVLYAFALTGKNVNATQSLQPNGKAPIIGYDVARVVKDMVKTGERPWED